MSDAPHLDPPTPDASPFSPRGRYELTRAQRAARPIVRAAAHLEIPGFGRLLRRFGVRTQSMWADAPFVQSRERISSHEVRLDLSDYYQRIAYFMGCYHETHIQRVLRDGLREGDVYVDGGANIGLTVLAATTHVGPQGTIHAFEPSPLALASLRWHVDHNALSNVIVHEVGLSDEAEELMLTMPRRDNIGGGTLGPLPARHHDQFYKKWPARTELGDTCLARHPIETPMLIKLDVEGFEHRAIRGLSRTIETHRPAIVAEVNGECLRVNGSSPARLADLMRSLGYAPFSLRLSRWNRQRTLSIREIDRGQLRSETDVLFLHPSGPHWRRFKRA